MGNDGGTFPTKKDLFSKKKKKGNQKDHLQRQAKAKLCALSHLPLEEPIVFDKKGNIFNKEALIKHILDSGE